MAFGSRILFVLPIGKVISNSQANGEDDLPCPWLDNLFVIGFGDFIMILKANTPFDANLRGNFSCSLIFNNRENSSFLGASISTFVNDFRSCINGRMWSR